MSRKRKWMEGGKEIGKYILLLKHQDRAKAKRIEGCVLFFLHFFSKKFFPQYWNPSGFSLLFLIKSLVWLL